MEGFVQQLAVAYVARGYYFYVTASSPRARTRPGSTPSSAPATAWGCRSGRGPAAGPPGRRATPTSGTGGSSCSWPRTARARSSSRRPESVRDARRTPIRFSGYAISHRGGHVHVRIDRPVYLGLKAYLVGIAAHRDEAGLAAEVRRVLDFEPYAPVRSQCRAILPGGQPGAGGGRAARGAADRASGRGGGSSGRSGRREEAIPARPLAPVRWSGPCRSRSAIASVCPAHRGGATTAWSARNGAGAEMAGADPTRLADRCVGPATPKSN